MLQAHVAKIKHGIVGFGGCFCGVEFYLLIFWYLYFEPIEFKGYRKCLAQYSEEISFKVTGQVRTIQKHYAVSEFTNSLLAGGLQHWPFS